jgi:hypothetical protein
MICISHQPLRRSRKQRYNLSLDTAVHRMAGLTDLVLGEVLGWSPRLPPPNPNQESVREAEGDTAGEDVLQSSGTG